MSDYTLIRSKRKTVALYITKDANVQVRAPLKMPKAEIDRFVASKERWIRKHLAVREQNLKDKGTFTVSYGSKVLMRGQEYPIIAREGNRAGLDGEGFYLPPGLSAEEIKRITIQIYKRVAKNFLMRKVIDFAKVTGLAPTAVKVNSAKTRWGSCSTRNSLNFSWRLIMMEDDIIDYVVVHELAHIKEHNHSDRFWAVVRSVLPDYVHRKAKLKDMQKRLAGEDWD
ncbi:MAG: M48 family metallopeptidase [Peptococcaceae bacterium]|nr:M48 family metallopeptidase [Peptococcaceae bacterium]